MSEQSFTDLEASILLILEEHQGQPEAISRENLVRQVCDLEEFKISERAIRQAIKHLITQHGIAIGSCHRGYFMAATPQEIEKVCKYYDSYGLSSLFVSSKLRKIEMAQFLGQLSIRFSQP
jgi:biotin operon repressor